MGRARDARPAARPADPQPPHAPQRDLFLPALLLLTLVAKAVVLAQLHAHPLLQPGGGLDSEVYVALGRRVAAGDLALGPEPFFVAPLYAYFLGVVFALTGGSLLAAKAAQIALGTAAVALVHATTRRFAGDLAARSAAILLAMTGVLTFSEVTLLQSALDPFLAALALHLLARALLDPRPRGFVIAGLALGLFALNRPNALAVAAGLAALLTLQALAGRARIRALQAAALVAGAALAIAPVTLRNLAVSGEPVVIASHGGLNFWIGNHAGADGTYRPPPGLTPNIAGQARDVQRLAEAASGRRLSASAASAWFTRRALDWWRAEPGAALGLQARKLAYVFNAAELPLNFSFAWYAHEESTLLRALIVGPWLLLPLGLVGLTGRALDGARPDRTAFRLWAACVPLYAASVALFFVAGRYRQPLLLALAVGAGLALERLRDALRGRDARALAASVAATLALTVATQHDFGFDDGREAERAALVAWLIDNGRLDEAAERIEGAGPSARPDLLARVQFALGASRLAQGDAAGAVDPLRAAARDGETGRRAEALEKLGLALGLQGRTAEALGALDEACRLAPRTASAHLNRAVLLTQLGRFDEARAAADEALRLEPQYDRARRLRDELAREAARSGDRSQP